MAEFPINWQLQCSHSNQRKKNRSNSKLEINTEWSIICLWSAQSERFGELVRPSPEFLKIRRNSTVGDILVSGTFKLMRNEACVLQRKFIQLIEDGFATTLLELNYSVGSNYFNKSYSYFVTGTLTIPFSGTRKEYPNGINFDSLLELSSDFGTLLGPKATYFSDMILKCGTLSFPVHKNILSVRSPVFAAKFTTEMKKISENEVNISDISPPVLETMLLYIYTGKIGALSVKRAAELLFGADKYQLLHLKKVCCEYLKSCVSVENILKILVLGYFHDQDLKIFALNFICNSSNDFEVLLEKAEWKNLAKKRPSLVVDVLTLLVKSKDLKLRIIASIVDERSIYYKNFIERNFD